MSPENAKLTGDGSHIALFWSGTLLFVLSWVHVLTAIHQQWTTLSGPLAERAVAFAVLFPLPWVVMFGDWRRRRDTVVLLVVGMTYAILLNSGPLISRG